MKLRSNLARGTRRGIYKSELCSEMGMKEMLTYIFFNINMQLGLIKRSRSWCSVYHDVNVQRILAENFIKKNFELFLVLNYELILILYFNISLW